MPSAVAETRVSDTAIAETRVSDTASAIAVSESQGLLQKSDKSIKSKNMTLATGG